MHWYISVRMLLRATSCSMLPPSPSARPLSKSRATIIKSLSGASYWSGWALFSWNQTQFFENLLWISYWGSLYTSCLSLEKCLWRQEGWDIKFLKIPWLVQESSVLGLHNADTQVHSMEGSQTAGLWQLKIGTRKNKVHNR